MTRVPSGGMLGLKRRSWVMRVRGDPDRVSGGCPAAVPAGRQGFLGQAGRRRPGSVHIAGSEAGSRSSSLSRYGQCIRLISRPEEVEGFGSGIASSWWGKLRCLVHIIRSFRCFVELSSVLHQSSCLEVQSISFLIRMPARNHHGCSPKAPGARRGHRGLEDRRPTELKWLKVHFDLLASWNPGLKTISTYWLPGTPS